MKIQFKEEVKAVFNSSIITLSNGIVIEALHEQECCEEVYADFRALEDTDFQEQVFISMEFLPVRNNGFNIFLGKNNSLECRYFIPCYNSQNGYYSSNIELLITVNDIIITQDFLDDVKLTD